MHALARRMNTVLGYQNLIPPRPLVSDRYGPHGSSPCLKVHRMRAVFDEIFANGLKRRSGPIPYRRYRRSIAGRDRPSETKAGVSKPAPDSHRLTHMSSLITPVDSVDDPLPGQYWMPSDGQTSGPIDTLAPLLCRAFAEMERTIAPVA
jgi:hypothetical protein